MRQPTKDALRAEVERLQELVVENHDRYEKDLKAAQKALRAAESAGEALRAELSAEQVRHAQEVSALERRIVELESER